MQTNRPSPSTPTEGTALPPPRSFGETNTLTLCAGHPTVAGLVTLADQIPHPGTLRVAVFPADPLPQTLTF